MLIVFKKQKQIGGKVAKRLIENAIRNAIPVDEVSFRYVYSHIEITVVSEVFEGISLMDRIKGIFSLINHILDNAKHMAYVNVITPKQREEYRERVMYKSNLWR